jgi:hypothetical protein
LHSPYVWRICRFIDNILIDNNIICHYQENVTQVHDEREEEPPENESGNTGSDHDDVMDLTTPVTPRQIQTRSGASGCGPGQPIMQQVIVRVFNIVIY